jgi:hypothetical protein
VDFLAKPIIGRRTSIIRRQFLISDHAKGQAKIDGRMPTILYITMVGLQMEFPLLPPLLDELQS